MYAAPPVLQTAVFARIPETLRIKGRTNRWIDVQRGGAPTDCFLEGPTFDRAGNLYVVDVAWGRIFRISPQGQVELFTEYDGEPNGLKIHRDGRIFVADYRHGIMVIDPTTRAVKPFLDRAALDRFKGVNDLVFASNGDLYFTDQGLTGLHDPTGSLYLLRRRRPARPAPGQHSQPERPGAEPGRERRVPERHARQLRLARSDAARSLALNLPGPAALMRCQPAWAPPASSSSRPPATR